MPAYSLVKRQRRPAPEEQYSLPTMSAPLLPEICAVSFVGVQRPNSRLILRFTLDYATLTRIVSNSVRFRCPYCGAYHSTQVAAARPEAIWVRPQEASRARHATPNAGELDYVEGLGRLI
jgi:hypothetical protein